jgi:Tfp pilus assembly protein FimT
VNNERLKNPVSNSKGITLVEILLALGLLVILLSFAMPSVSNAVNISEMKATLENVRYSLHIASRTARVTETSVSVNISDSGQDTTQTITFTSPGKDEVDSNLRIQDFRLPSEILLISDHKSFVFDERGQVENPGRILLVSTLDEAVTSTFSVK